MRTPHLRCHVGNALCALLLGAWVASPAHAALITYNFNSPNFTLGEATPLLNRAPNVGDPTVLASFTASPLASGFEVLNFQPNPLFAGASLTDPLGGGPQTLTVTLNQPVDSVQFAFGIDQPPAGPFGSITFQSPVGNQTTPAGNVGGAFQGGTFTFSSPTPFTTFSLLANTSTGAGVEFAIDNLTLNTAQVVIPEPASVALLGFAGLGLLTYRWRQKRAAADKGTS